MSRTPRDHTPESSGGLFWTGALFCAFAAIGWYLHAASEWALFLEPWP